VAVALSGEAQEPLRITTNFGDQTTVSPMARLELHLSRPLASGEGSLALFIANIDVTALSERGGDTLLMYAPGFVGLPLGEQTVIVYRVSPENQWVELARLSLRVQDATPPPPTAAPGAAAPPARAPSGRLNFVPTVSVNTKAQSTAEFFPASSRPNP